MQIFGVVWWGEDGGGGIFSKKAHHNFIILNYNFPVENMPIIQMFMGDPTRSLLGRIIKGVGLIPPPSPPADPHQLQH